MNLWAAFSLRTLQPFHFRNFSKLIKLNLGFNNWTRFDPSILPVSLTSIYLNYAFRLSAFPNFTGWTPNLDEISIQGNIISDIPRENIRIPHITQINIGRNRLISIPDYTAYPYIKVLLLHKNHLTTIPDFFNTTLTKLALSDNPLVCDSALCWIRIWPWMFDTPLLADNPTCASPSIATGTSLMEVRPVHMECFKGKLIIYHQRKCFVPLYDNTFMCNWSPQYYCIKASLLCMESILNLTF